MKKPALLAALFCLIISSSYSQVGININAGIATSSKINHATNKSATPVGGAVYYSANHFEGGLAGKLFLLSDPSYSSVLDIGLFANGKVPFSRNMEDRGSYMTIGGALGYGSSDFGNGLSVGLQLTYGYQLSRHFAITAAIAPRYFSFKTDQDLYNGKWSKFQKFSVDRFMIIPFTVGINVIF